MGAEETQARESGELGQVCHPACLVCRAQHEGGLGLRFEQQADGSVISHFACDSDYQGYPDRLHGGVVAMLLDAAMTNCLFAQQIRAVTGKLNVRFRHPVKVGAEAVVRARLVDQSPPLYLLEAELMQHDTLCAHAEGSFYADESAERPDEQL